MESKNSEADKNFIWMLYILRYTHSISIITTNIPYALSLIVNISMNIFMVKGIRCDSYFERNIKFLLSYLAGEDIIFCSFSFVILIGSKKSTAKYSDISDFL